MSYKDITRPVSTAYTSCPHIISSRDGTQYCDLAEATSRDRRENVRILRQAMKDIIHHQTISGGSFSQHSAIKAIARRALERTGGV